MFVDILIILFFAFCVYRGIKKGFAQTVIGLCSYIVALIISVLFFDGVKGFLYTNSFTAGNIEKFRLGIAESIEANIVKGSADLPAFLKIKVGDMGGDFATEISLAVVEAVLAVLFFAFVLVAIKIFSVVISRIVKIPVLKQFNSILGGAVGALNGLFVCYIFGAILIFSLVNWGNQWFINQVDSSFMGEFFFKNNIILNILIGL